MKEDLEPGGNNNNVKRTTLLRNGNTERYIDYSLLYMRGQAFGHPSIIVEPFHDFARVLRDWGSRSKR